ncbi:MAG: high potential iron sulfur protein [Methyloceanibacter sp.]|jgi:hypothetical protein
MADKQKLWSTNISRRSVWQGVTYAVAATPIILGTTHPAFAAKMSQSSVGYQNSPNGNQSCANCKLFVAPSSCISVESPVSADGWCKIYVKA